MIMNLREASSASDHINVRKEMTKTEFLPILVREEANTTLMTISNLILICAQETQGIAYVQSLFLFTIKIAGYSIFSNNKQSTK